MQCLGLAQIVPHMPQLSLLSFVSTQMPLHSVRPAGHLQAPAWQVEPPLQTLPHAPQSRPFVCTFTQTPLQLVSVESVHLHAPAVQV
jgi:hypothetical protein